MGEPRSLEGQRRFLTCDGQEQSWREAREPHLLGLVRRHLPDDCPRPVG